MKSFIVRMRCMALMLAMAVAAPVPAVAQTGMFDRGWTLQSGSSALNFQSVKNVTKVESSSFATFAGQITPDGTATVSIQMESVDTKIDLRNVRMRFLLFETFQFPEALVVAKLDPALLADLVQSRRKTVRLPYSLELHGVTKSFEADVLVTLLTDDLVAVSTNTPISVATADFNLDDGVAKLEEAAGVDIIPSASVTFDFLFSRNAAGDGAQTIAEAPATSGSAALETAGNFDAEACRGRFEILSRTDNIYFRAGSAVLDSKSTPLLDTLVDVVSRCPGMMIEVGGHTDSDGSAQANQRLSERRAASVTEYIQSKGIDPQRVKSVGYGEERPVVANDTPENKRRNRRIEFAVING